MSNEEGECKSAVNRHAPIILWVAHNLERTAGRVTSICERVVFTVTGNRGAGRLLR